MKPILTVTPGKQTRARIGRVGTTVFVIGLSATGAVFFSATEAPAAAVNTEIADSAAGKTVQKDLNVKWSEVKKSAAGIEFTSRDYAEALGMDRQAVVRALQKKFKGIRDEQIKIDGIRIFIADPELPGLPIFENLCIHLTINLCGKS